MLQNNTKNKYEHDCFMLGVDSKIANQIKPRQKVEHESGSENIVIIVIKSSYIQNTKERRDQKNVKHVLSKRNLG